MKNSLFFSFVFLIFTPFFGKSQYQGYNVGDSAYYPVPGAYRSLYPFNMVAKQSLLPPNLDLRTLGDEVDIGVLRTMIRDNFESPDRTPDSVPRAEERRVNPRVRPAQPSLPLTVDELPQQIFPFGQDWGYQVGLNNFGSFQGHGSQSEGRFQAYPNHFTGFGHFGGFNQFENVNVGGALGQEQRGQLQGVWNDPLMQRDIRKDGKSTVNVRGGSSPPGFEPEKRTKSVRHSPVKRRRTFDILAKDLRTWVRRDNNNKPSEAVAVEVKPSKNSIE